MTAVNSEILGDALIALGKNIKSGRCQPSQEQMDHVFSEMEKAVDISISKEAACGMLGISRSTFDAKVASGKLPHGKHRRGFKELYFSKREIINASRNERYL